MSGYRIGYAVVPGFYAAVERLDDPALRARPVVVGGDPGKRGKVQSASPDALAGGVVVGMPMDEVLARLPDAALVRTDMRRYREVSNALQSTLREAAHGLEADGLNAGYYELDRALHDDREGVTRMAQRLVQAVREEVGLALRLGIAPVKFLARLVAEESANQADDYRCIARMEVDAFLRPIAVERLPGVGSKTWVALTEMKIENVGDLRARDPREVERVLGRQAGRILSYAHGHDPAVVRVARHPKTLSLEFTFDCAVTDRARVDVQLRALCQDAEARMRQQSLACERTSLKLRYHDADKPRTWTRKLTRPVSAAEGLYASCQQLLDRSEVGMRAVRLLGVSLAGLAPRSDDDRQLDLFDA